MAYTYDYNETTLIGTVRLNGTPLFQIDVSIPENVRAHGHLATQRWLDAINAGDGSIDQATKRVQITSIALDETIKTDDTRAEVVALLTEFASQLETDVGLTTARSRALVKILWKFLKRALALMGR